MPRVSTYHDALRKVGLGDDDSSHSFQQLDQNAVLVCWLERAADIAQRAVIPFDVELVFQRHGHTVQRPDKSSMLFEVGVQLARLLERIVEKNLRKAGRL